MVTVVMVAPGVATEVRASEEGGVGVTAGDLTVRGEARCWVMGANGEERPDV